MRPKTQGRIYKLRGKFKKLILLTPLTRTRKTPAIKKHRPVKYLGKGSFLKLGSLEKIVVLMELYKLVAPKKLKSANGLPLKVRNKVVLHGIGLISLFMNHRTLRTCIYVSVQFL